MKKDLILIALKDEAPDMAFSMNVFYTGVGKVNAAMTAAELIAKYKPDRVINFGTAGGVTVKSGFHQVTKFVQRDMMCCELGSQPGQTPFEDTIVIDNGNGLTCSTGDNFVTDTYNINADLVDMEAFAIAKACVSAGVEFICHKYISDMANDEAPDHFIDHVHKGEDHYIAILKEYGVEL